MKTWIYILSLAYLLGSIPFGYLLTLFFSKQDIRTIGSGNIGATNVLRSGARWLGVATLLLDSIKAFAVVKLAQQVSPGNISLAALAAVVAVLGHVFPIWLGFKGGKGVASALGVFLALSWPAALCAVAVFIVTVAITRFVSLASILAAASLPVCLCFFDSSRSLIFILSGIFLALLIIVKHRTNIARLRAGTESRLGSRPIMRQPQAK